MSNTPITPIGLGPQSPAQTPGQVVQIVSLPDSLAQNARAIRMQGEVTQQNKDGSVRIRTPEGDIDVQVRGRQPQAGQKVEVEIPAGSPPKTATMRPAPAQPPVPQPQLPPVTGQPVPQPNIPLPQTPVTRPAPLPPQQGGTTQPLPAQPPAVDSAGRPLPPLPTSYPAPAKPATPQAPGATAPPLITGQVVRLTPVMPAQIQQLQTTLSGLTAEPALSAQISRTVFQADLIARSGQDNLQKTLIQTLKSSLVPAPTPQPNAAPQTAAAPTTTQQTIKNILSAIFAPAPTETPGIKIASTMPLMPSLAGAASLENTLNPSMPAMRPLMLDAKILEIKLPQVQILASASNAAPGATPAANTGTASSIIGLPADVLSGGARPTGIVATVTGFTPQNLPLINIQWPNTASPQNYILQFASGNLETGSQLVLLPQASAQGSLQAASALKPLLPLLQPSMLWPATDDVFQALLQTSPGLAQALGKIIPSPGNAAQMGPAALLFIAAAKAGDLQNWLGEKKLEALQKIGRQSLINRLSGELSSLSSAAANDAPSSDWRSFPVPMLWQNEISKVMFHVHHDHGPNEQDEGQGGTRFIFDLSLTRMGDVQLDGLLRDKRLDLIIRTQIPVSESMQQAMRLAYSNALDGSEIYGELAFQGDLKNWMHVVKREEMFGANA